jgi:hypothetical protein
VAVGPPSDNDQVPADYMELYKLAVEMADRISARRGTANAFFVTINTALLAFLGLAELRAAWPVALGGLVISATWALLIKSYRDLNTAKFKTINAAEERLPIKIFTEEWQNLKKARPEKWVPSEWRRWLQWYVEFTIVEMLVPGVFAFLYLVILIDVQVLLLLALLALVSILVVLVPRSET